MEDRFEIKRNKRGVQMHNMYIQQIIDGIIKYDTDRGIIVEKPDCLYGMLYTNKEVLVIWEEELKREGYLK